jgi:hypothetical protein
MRLASLLSDDNLYSPRAQLLNQIVALVLVALVVRALWTNIGLPPTMIVGGSALVGFLFWRATNLRRAIEPQKTTILFLLTVAALHVHMLEEHACLFGPAMSRLFGIAFPDERFLLIFVFAGPTIYYLTAVGLLLRIPFAAFVAWFIFIGPGLAEFTHFLFPLIEPAIEPANLAPVTSTVNGQVIENMPNHYFFATGTYYFPGLYTAIIPMIPGAWSVVWLWRNRHGARSGDSHRATALSDGESPAGAR